MEIGDITASAGMTKAIFDKLAELLEPDLGEVSPEELEKIRLAWRKIALAVATGVIDHMKAHMEIVDVRTRGKVNTNITGKTGGTSDPPNDPNHQHAVDLAGKATNVVFTQVAGTGHVR